MSHYGLRGPTSESDMYRGKVLRKVPAKASRLCKPSEAVL